MADVNVEALKSQWVGHTFDTAEFKVREQSIADWAAACGETDPRFTDLSHPDYRAHPTFTAQFVSRRVLPKGFPQIGPGFGFDGGKCVTVYAPVRPGDRLRAHSMIADIYKKTGRSGEMIFIVHRMEFRNQDDQLVSVVDWRLVQQVETPEKGGSLS
ncbi:MAG: MaoC family dehydratase N-terminal domain-containing protein [Myxococcota bacterium]